VRAAATIVQREVAEHATTRQQPSAEAASPEFCEALKAGTVIRRWRRGARKRTDVISTRVDYSERERIESLARAAGMSLSDFIRSALASL
jgi:hypothetical protein